MRSQFVNGLRDGVRRFVMSRDPLTCGDAAAYVVKEEANELLSGSMPGI